MAHADAVVLAQFDLIADALTDGGISTSLQVAIAVTDQTAQGHGLYGIHRHGIGLLGLELRRLGTVVTGIGDGVTQG